MKRRGVDMKDVGKMVKMIKNLKKACVEKDKVYEIECEYCGGKAECCISSYNGHFRFKCKDCGCSLIQ